MKDETYREYLIQIYNERKSRNHSYTLNAFSRDAGLKVGHISNILNGHTGLSLLKAESILNNLGITDNAARDYFLLMVKSDYARSKAERESAKKKLFALQLKNKKFRNFSEEQQSILSDWHYVAICELSQHKNFVYDNQWIAQKLNLPEEQVAASIEKLLEFDVLREENGQLKYEPANFSTNDVPSQVIRSYQKSIIKKSYQATDEQAVDDRDMSSVMFLMDKEDIKEAKRRIRQFRIELAKDLESRSSSAQLYSFSMQLFNLAED